MPAPAGKASLVSSGAALAIDYFEELIGGIAAVLIILSVSWGVLTRYVTAQPAAWASEVATIAFCWLVFFGSAACIKYRLHPAIDGVLNSLPEALRKFIGICNEILIFAFLAFMVWYGTVFALDGWDTPTAVLQLPTTILYAPVAIASLLMIVRKVQVIRLGPVHDEANDATRGSYVG